MSATHTRPGFGRALGEAARNLTRLHRQALADFDTDFPTWMLLSLLTENQAGLPRPTVEAELTRRMDLAPADTAALLHRTAEAGLTAADSDSGAVRLTAAGTAHFAGLYAHSRAVTDAAADGVGAEALATAVEVLVAVEARAGELLAHSGG